MLRFIMLLSIISSLIALASASVSDEALGALRLLNTSSGQSRLERQAMYLYLCGTYPYQYYSYTPCSNNNVCPNGGTKLTVGCTSSIQCTPYSTGPVQCLNNCCCTVPNTTPTTQNSGVCYHGQLSQVQCSARGQCAAGQTCMNGLCCTTTGNEYTAACGGLAATASCSNGACANGNVCTPSNYCCECPVGRTSGKCNNGACPAGFSCRSNGYCCATCPNNATPWGSCRNGVCGNKKTCCAGNICC